MNDLIELDIEKLVYGGKGLGRHNGQVIFVPGTLPGERVLVALRKEHKSFSDADLVEILTPSDIRQTPPCPLALGPLGRRPPWPVFCAGCRTQHVLYKDELALKQEQFDTLLEPLSSLSNATIKSPLASPNELAYRNKLMFRAYRDGNDLRLGYVHDDNVSLLDIEHCPLGQDELNVLLKELRAKEGFLHSLRDGMQVTLRWTPHDGAVFWRGRKDPKGQWLREDFFDGQLSVPRGSFYQVNTAAGKLLIDETKEILEDVQPESVLDLFCGVGVFALTASKVKSVSTIRGVDNDEAAIQAAEYNAKQLDSPATFVTDQAASSLKSVCRGMDMAKTCVITDPPRAGLIDKTISQLTRLRPQSILYISCAADTLVRDIGRLEHSGYELKQTRLIDMFPRTAHFETVSLLSLS